MIDHVGAAMRRSLRIGRLLEITKLTVPVNAKNENSYSLDFCNYKIARFAREAEQVV